MPSHSPRSIAFHVDDQPAYTSTETLFFAQGVEGSLIARDFKVHQTEQGKIGLPFFIYKNLGSFMSAETVLLLPENCAPREDAAIDGFITRKGKIRPNTEFEMPYETTADGETAVFIAGALEAAKKVPREIMPLEAWLDTKVNEEWKSAEPIIINANGLAVSRTERTASMDDVLVASFSRREHLALVLLAERRNEECALADIAKSIWKTDKIDRETIDGTVTALRLKLKRAGYGGLITKTTKNTYLLTDERDSA